MNNGPKLYRPYDTIAYTEMKAERDDLNMRIEKAKNLMSELEEQEWMTCDGKIPTDVLNVITDIRSILLYGE
jgi:hypothetical protein